MLKGINKNVIFVRTDSKSRFEAVYFVLRKGGSGPRSDMLREANRIISESGITDSKRSRRARLRYTLFALCGALFGAVAGVGVCLLIFL